jgi:hypothetical protein
MDQQIRALYLAREGGLPPLVPYGHLPTVTRRGAPEEEIKARVRMHNLLKPVSVASSAEVEVLRAAGIPLKKRPGGGSNIDPAVQRAAVEARAAGSLEIRALYLPREGGLPPLVPYGHLPTIRRKGAPEEEIKARVRMHSLLKPASVARPAEVEVLRAAGIPLKKRPGGGSNIDPAVQRESGQRRGRALPRAGVLGPVYGQGSAGLLQGLAGSSSASVQQQSQSSVGELSSYSQQQSQSSVGGLSSFSQGVDPQPSFGESVAGLSQSWAGPSRGLGAGGFLPSSGGDVGSFADLAGSSGVVSGVASGVVSDASDWGDVTAFLDDAVRGVPGGPVSGVGGLSEGVIGMSAVASPFSGASAGEGLAGSYGQQALYGPSLSGVPAVAPSYPAGPSGWDSSAGGESAAQFGDGYGSDGVFPANPVFSHYDGSGYSSFQGVDGQVAAFSQGAGEQPSYGQQQPSYREPSYGEQPSSYGQQQPSYGQQQPSLYGDPSYGEQPSSYGQQQPSYGQQQPSYREPSYGEQPSSYGESSYGEQSSSFGVVASSVWDSSVVGGVAVQGGGAYGGGYPVNPVGSAGASPFSGGRGYSHAGSSSHAASSSHAGPSSQQGPRKRR